MQHWSIYNTSIMVVFTMSAVIFLLFLLSLRPLFLSSPRCAKQKLPPGPANLPLIGNLHRFGELPQRSLHKLSQKHGPLMYLKLGTVPVVVASSADTAREFLKTHDLQCCSRPLLTSLRKLSYGFSDIAFSPYGEQWRELRKICILELFSTKKVSSFRFVREEEVQRMIDSISISSQQNHYEINLSEELLLLANIIMCRAALGKTYYNDRGRPLHRILSETEALFTGFFFADYIPMLGWLDAFTGMRARLERNFHELDGFYQLVIDEHVDAKMRREDDSRDEDLIDSLLAIKKKAAHLTYDHIKGVLMDIFIAGTDTSSALAEWVMAELLKNPKVMKKAQDEVRSLIRNKEKVEETDLDQLQYLKSVIKETLRLHPPVPLFLQRETIQDCKIHDYDIPAKTRLLISAWAIGRDPNVWERADEFYPDRFMNNPIDYRGHHFQFIPFGAGRRICLGMQSGILVVELALANLLYLFDWELPKGMSKEDIDMSEAPGVTVHKKLALHLVAKKFQGVKG